MENGEVVFIREALARIEANGQNLAVNVEELKKENMDLRNRVNKIESRMDTLKGKFEGLSIILAALGGLSLVMGIISTIQNWGA